jgi:hypothetical protein
VSEQGVIRLPTNSVLRQLFVLHFDSAGHATAIRTPVVPEIISTAIDLSKEFQDFFMPKPRGPLKLGLVWVDTLVVEGPTASQRFSKSTRIGRHEVVGDSVIAGTPVFVVVASTRQHVITSGLVPREPGLTAVSQLQGVAESRFYMARNEGHMMARRTSATFRGEVEYSGMPGRYSNTFKYEQRIDLARRSPR